MHARPLRATATERFWQCRIRTVCAGCCYLTDGLGLERIARQGGKEIAERGQEYFRRKLDVRYRGEGYSSAFCFFLLSCSESVSMAFPFCFSIFFPRWFSFSSRGSLEE